MLDKHRPPLASALKHLATVPGACHHIIFHPFIYLYMPSHKKEKEEADEKALEKPSKSRLSSAMKWKA